MHRNTTKIDTPTNTIQQNETFQAYIFIETKHGNFNEIIQKTKQLKNIESVDIVTGTNNFVLHVIVHDLEQLAFITEEIKLINGIEQATTRIIEKEIIP